MLAVTNAGIPTVTVGLLFIVSVMLLSTGLWTLVPGSSPFLLQLSVAAPELSPWIIALAVAVAALSTRFRGHRLQRFTIALALAATFAPAAVLWQVPATVAAFDREFERQFGADYLTRLPGVTRARLRPSAVRFVELFAGLRTGVVRVRRGVVFGTASGEPLTLTIYRPDSDDVFPIVVQVYGGGWQSGGPDDDSAPARALASAGYVIFAVDYRHAPRHRWPAQLDDVTLALSWIAAHAAAFQADAARIALFGRSSGSQLAVLAARSPGAPRVAAVVSYYGPVDLTEGYRNPPAPDPLDVRGLEQAFIGGTPDEMPDAYASASPLTFAAEPHPPTLIIAAGRDHIVEPRFSRRWHQALTPSGRAVLLIMPWADHAFDRISFGPSSQIALTYTERFLAWAFQALRPA